MKNGREGIERKEMESNTIHSTTLRDYLKIIFKHKIIFFILPVAIVIPLYFSLQLKTPTYTATVKIYIKALKESATQDYYKSIRREGSLAEEHTELLKSNIVIERVVKALKLYQQVPIDYEMQFASRFKAALLKHRAEELKQRLMKMSEKEREALLYRSAVERLSASISGEPIRETSFFLIHVSDFDPTFVQILANSVSSSYVIFDLEQQIEELKLKYGEKHSTVIQLKNYITDMEPRLDGRIVPDLEAIGPASIKIVEQAKSSSQEAGPDENVLIITAFFASIVLSVVFCFTFEILDQSIKLPKDIEIFLKIPYLGSVPERKSREKLLISDANPKKTIYTKSFEILSEKLSLLMRDNNLKTLLLTGGEWSKGTADVIANIAMQYAQKFGHKVLVIDADFINSSLTKILKVPGGEPGLADVLQGTAPLIDVIKDLGFNLYFLPSGEAMSSPVTLSVSPRMSDLLKNVSKQFDLVFINAPDAMSSADAIKLLSITDGMALVIDEGKVRRQVIESAVSHLKQKNINIVGAILNNRKYVVPEIIYRVT